MASGSKSAKLFFPLVVVVLVAVYAVVFFWQHNASEKSVTLVATPGTTIEFGLSSNSDKGPGIKTLLQTSSRISGRFKKGSYAVLYSGNKDYQTQSETLQLNEDVVLTTPALSYNSIKLADLLKQKAPQIHAALLSTGYSVQDERLYDDGNWYAAKLAKAGAALPEVIVLHFQNSKWAVAAGPYPTLYAAGYPNIPPDIIPSADSF